VAAGQKRTPIMTVTRTSSALSGTPSVRKALSP
jgi:hypothetical protein